MAYTKTTWKDHVVEFPNRYDEVSNPDGTIDHKKVEGTITQQGTPVNANNLNKMEQGIHDAHETLKYTLSLAIAGI